MHIIHTYTNNKDNAYVNAYVIPQQFIIRDKINAELLTFTE